MNINKKLQNLREVMKNKGIDIFIIPSADNHGSEYVSEYFRVREWISGFTGSAGTVIVTLKEAHLWTDGRYFLQAEQQLKETEYILEKMGEPGVKNPTQWILDTVKDGETVAFNGKVFIVSELAELEGTLKNRRVTIKSEEDIVDEIWENRPSMPKGNLFIHELKYTGKSASEKIKEIRTIMKNEKIDNFLLASLDDIAWTLNLRGQDVPCNPVFLSYLLIEKENVTLYIDMDKITSSIEEILKEANVQVKSYDEVVLDVEKLNGNITYDATKTNVWLKKAIPQGVKVIERRNITTELKAKKNRIELENIENCQVKDGVAMVKFLKWLKEAIKTEELTEISVSDKLREFRELGEGFIDISFDSISGYGPNGAIVHYKASKENQAKLQNRGLYLIDSGAQYLDGTTDITRTIVVGELTEEEKTDYTLVLKGNLNLSSAVFLYGTPGCSLDILARRPLWNRGLDYKHGTGHGVGYLLNVHEGPHGIRRELNNVILEEGMIISNEPGIYRAGKHGIRLENLVAVQTKEENEYGKFMEFKVLTYCPFDLEAIDLNFLNEEEKQWLNDYHKTVFEKLQGSLNGEEKDWLRNATRMV